MKRLRHRLARLVPAVAALFALSIAAPQAALYYHEHAGGTHAHVHADEEGISTTPTSVTASTPTTPAPSS